MVGLEKDYIYIKNVLNENELSFLNKYVALKHHTNHSCFDDEQTALGETSFYGDPVMEIMLDDKLKLFQEHLKQELFPTYSFWRCYTKFSDLEKHTDRPACEITVSVNLAGCGTEWPLFINGTPIEIKKGDGVLYFGAKTEHWREEFKGDWQAQVFLHYVLKNGEHKTNIFDGRKGLGFSN